MNKNFHNVSLGQGQEVVAEEAMSIAANSEFKLLQSNSVNTTLVITNSVITISVNTNSIIANSVITISVNTTLVITNSVIKISVNTNLVIANYWL